MRRLLLLAALAAVACGARAPKEETMAQMRERVFAVAQAQAVYMDSLLSFRAIYTRHPELREDNLKRRESQPYSYGYDRAEEVGACPHPVIS